MLRAREIRQPDLIPNIMNALRVSLLIATTLLGSGATAAPLLRKALPIDIGEVRNADAGPLVSADFNGDGFPTSR
jgi:hypothetical protein